MLVGKNLSKHNLNHNTAKKNKNRLLMKEEIKPVIFNINYLIFGNLLKE